MVVVWGRWNSRNFLVGSCFPSVDSSYRTPFGLHRTRDTESCQWFCTHQRRGKEWGGWVSRLWERARVRVTLYWADQYICCFRFRSCFLWQTTQWRRGQVGGSRERSEWPLHPPGYPKVRPHLCKSVERGGKTIVVRTLRFWSLRSRDSDSLYRGTLLKTQEKR